MLHLHFIACLLLWEKGAGGAGRGGGGGGERERGGGAGMGELCSTPSPLQVVGCFLSWRELSEEI